ncbi:MAG: hypothetical protein ACP5GZ_07890 [Vulcanisaeta sp.]|jgi:hypothetical protein|uniref:hypothetical protein n=1 Tax=Vulcanisaeta sp. TaxID=2020871 RepID=UPI003D0B0BDC
MLIYIVRAMNELRRCLAVYDEFECTAYINKTYGTWMVRLSNDEANAILSEASRSCTQVEGSFLYCIFCVGSQCSMEPSESVIKYIIDCLDRLSIKQGVKDTLKNMLNKAMEVNSEVACSGE